MPWPVVLAAGGPRERGRAYGAQAADRVRRSVEIYERVFALYAQLPWTAVRGRAAAFVDAIDAYDVQLLPEIEGIAEGAGIEAEDVLAVNLRTEVMFGLDARAAHAAMKECTALGFGPELTGGPVVIAQNWDWKPLVRDTCVLLVCAPHDRPGFVTFVEAGLWAKCGANEAGIGLATNALQSSRDHGGPGVPYHAILRRVLTSTTFEEAVEAVMSGPRASSANYLIGHRDGRSIDLETTPGGPDDGFTAEEPGLAHANHFLWPSPRPFKDVGRIDGEDSLVRQARAERALTGNVTLDDVRGVLASHDDPRGTVCAHGDPTIDPAEDYVTVAAVIEDLKAGTIEISYGNPCEGSFETLSVAELLQGARASKPA